MAKKSTPGSSDTFNHGAVGDPKDYKPTYFVDDKLPKHSASYAVYHDKTEAAKSGVMDQKGPKVDGQSYPGRPLPPVQQVTEAKEEKGATIICVQNQTGLNRYPINEHEEKEKHHGPNS